MYSDHLQFRHAVVRDLAWAVGSPALLQGNRYVTDFFCREQFTLHLDWFFGLDENPLALEVHVEGFEQEPLGRYFERLLDFWFRHSEHWILLGTNIQAIEQGITLGEFDFIVHEKATGIAWHFEVAIKFYLGMPPSDRCETWVGINGKDSLATKVGKMESRQLDLPFSAAGKMVLDGLGVGVVQSAGFVKGVLAYPAHQLGTTLGIPTFANKAHCTSYWGYLHHDANDWADQSLTFANLPRYSWLGGVLEPEKCGSWDQIKHEVQGEWDRSSRQRSKWIVAYRESAGQLKEVNRCFVLPDSWVRG